MTSRQGFTRGDKVRKALIREVSDVLAAQLKDPSVANELVSVIDIDLSKDLRHARVYLSVMGDEETKARVMEVVEEKTPRIRSEVGQRIRMRYTPELVFYLDDSLERGARVSQLLDQISKGEV
ncbi:MAG: 30S ribosome-binding factor RbfA [Vampirovibrio sp.]|nr:30S ribosome-binding factor RbfA [Vampirovibrio sp.]